MPRFTPVARDLVAALAPSPHEIVLDVGTGTGLIARIITATEPLARVVGVDPSPAMLAVARATSGHVVDAGLDALTLQRREYHHALSVPQFLAGWGSRDRYLRHTVGEQRWQHFVARAGTALRHTFGAAIPAVSHVWIAIGTR